MAQQSALPGACWTAFSSAALAPAWSLRVDVLEVGKAAEQSFVGSQLVRVSVAQRLAHAVRQNAMRVGDGRDDARDEVVLQFEDGFGLKARS